ncbi:membrane bound O-acyl transferase family-domain-containing protein [Cyathus striatus]|nr:membrane bound O-acyl transferase family-domain-containing protein [Cyathus striatus]
MFNLRGCGWSWCKGLYLPQEKRPVSSKAAFILATLSSFISHLVLGDIIHYSVQWFSPSTIGSAAGGTIYDATLPPVTRYIRSTVITFLAGMTIYSAIQTAYDGLSLIGIIFFGQKPSQWPPIFDAPWCATSLGEFWAKRWHQLFRDNFISIGAKPFTLLGGRAGGVIGAFYVSGLMHDMGMWGMGRGVDFRRVGGYFVVNGFGVLVEQGWKKLTGKKVGGMVGWIWTMLWVISWGNMLVDAWCSRGLAGSKFFPQSLRPTDYIFGPL